MIKYFNSLNDSINYRTNCPNCQSKLILNQNDAVVDTKNKDNLIFNLFEDDLLYINLYEDNLKIKSSNKKSLGVNYTYKGITYHKLSIECDCCLFGYLLQIKTDLSNLKLLEICLNSERISFEDSNGILHEIVNNYIKKNTTYTNYDPYTNYNHSPQSLPIINLDLDNISNTVKKIKNILVFT
jgi:hypothetical protein